jgi:hypothetical protein
MPIKISATGRVKVKAIKRFSGPSKVYNSLYSVSNFIKVQSYKDLNSNKNKRLSWENTKFKN